MNLKMLTLSVAVAAILMAGSPMVNSSMSTDNGGTKKAIDAYSDGAGVLVINQSSDTKFDNSAMNKLVFKYGDAAKLANTTLKNQITVLSTTATVIEKDDATTKLEVATITINPPSTGSSCTDNNNATYNDVYNGSSCVGTYVTSCKSIKTITPSSTDGNYVIDPDGSGAGASFSAYCDMTTDGGGWTHIGTIADNNEGVNTNAHIWSSFNATQNTNIWQDATTYGASSFASDFKGQAWSKVAGGQLLIKDSGASLRNVLATNIGQINTFASFSSFMAGLTWGAIGSDLANTAYANNRVFSAAITTYGVNDPVLSASTKTRLLFKFGESDGMQDANKDRTMIAWHPHTAAENVDAPSGLGCFTLLNGAQVFRDIIPYANRIDSPPVSISPAPLAYTLFVR